MVGDHEVILAGENEQIRLAHRAEDRDIFARGALKRRFGRKTNQKGCIPCSKVLGL